MSGWVLEPAAFPRRCFMCGNAPDYGSPADPRIGGRWHEWDWYYETEHGATGRLQACGPCMKAVVSAENSPLADNDRIVNDLRKANNTIIDLRQRLGRHDVPAAPTAQDIAKAVMAEMDRRRAQAPARNTIPVQPTTTKVHTSTPQNRPQTRKGAA